jgi:hypothetical protein
MPIGTCDPASRGRGETYNEFAMEVPLPDGSGYVLIDCRYTWDGTSTRATGCDGPVIFLRTRNTGTSTAWAMLPDKKKAPLWVQLDPEHRRHGDPEGAAREPRPLQLPSRRPDGPVLVH